MIEWIAKQNGICRAASRGNYGGRQSGGNDLGRSSRGHMINRDNQSAISNDASPSIKNCHR